MSQTLGKYPTPHITACRCPCLLGTFFPGIAQGFTEVASVFYSEVYTSLVLNASWALHVPSDLGPWGSVLSSLPERLKTLPCGT